MLHHHPHLRFLLPVALTSTVSFALCVAMAVFLLREQASSAEALSENVDSRRAAANLEESLADLIALLGDRVEGTAALHARIQQHIADTCRHADEPQERAYAEKIATGFARYLTVWETLPLRTGADHDAARREAVRLLETETLHQCQELKNYNGRRIEASAQEHRATLRGLAWGLAGIGGSAALAGLFLGYGVARGLSRSIRRLQIRVADAAGKLAPDPPAIELTDDDLGQLDSQVRGLIDQVEQVVDRLQQREREVLRAEQLAAVGQLAAGVAHEIRNPLASIKMLVQAGGEGRLSPEDLGVIEREVRRIERSLQTFLDFARPPKPTKAPTDLLAVLDETLSLVRGRATRQGVDLSLDRWAGPAITLEADAGQLQQVFVNLALNALDAMPAGGRLTVTPRVAAGGRVEVAFADTGPGIAADVGPRLFQPFASTKPTGLGLGLVISRRIIEDHGGTLGAANDPAGGACFTVRLPS